MPYQHHDFNVFVGTVSYYAMPQSENWANMALYSFAIRYWRSNAFTIFAKLLIF